MCCDDKFLFFINMRLCSLIFGWIAVVITGLATLTLFIMDVVFINILFRSYGHDISNVQAVILITWILVNIASGFTATVFLMVGILQNKPAFLKGYMIYGMVHLSLFIIQQIVLEAMDTIYFTVIRVIIIVAIGIYVCILCTVYKTYKSMVTPNIFYNPPAQQA